MKTIRNFFFYGNYAFDFIKQQNTPMQKKIKFVFDVLRYEQVVPKQFIKHIEGTKGLYEIRVEAESNKELALKKRKPLIPRLPFPSSYTLTLI